MEQEKFEEGDWVWDWSYKEWHVIKRVGLGGDFQPVYELDNGDICSSRILTANPVIPPKPKRTVTKDANYCRDHWKGAFGKPFDCAEDEIRATGYATFIFPADATNIKVTYQVEE